MAKGKLVGIPPRKFKVNVSELEKNINTYYGNDKAITIFWNTLSMLFPEGEQFFVESVRKYRNDVMSDEQLQNEISGFIGQEAFHTHAHVKVNEALEKKGYPVKRVNRILKKQLGFLRKKNPLLALYVTAILEHYTATLASQLIDDLDHNSKVTGESRNLWMHHAIEEIEHRAVSFDVLGRVAGGWIDEVRIGLFIPVSIIFAGAVAVLYTYNLKKQDIKLTELVSILRLGQILFKNSPKLKDWFDRDFHPYDHQTDLSKAKAELGITD